MKRFIVKTNTGALVTVGADGFVPSGALGLAPIGVYEDSDLIEVTPGVVAVSEVKKAERLAREATQAAADKAVLEAKKAKLQAIEALKGKSLSAAEMKAAVEVLIDIVLDSNSSASIAAELLRRQLQSR